MEKTKERSRNVRESWRNLRYRIGLVLKARSVVVVVVVVTVAVIIKRNTEKYYFAKI